jgi:hypothetical protein
MHILLYQRTKMLRFVVPSQKYSNRVWYIKKLNDYIGWLKFMEMNKVNNNYILIDKLMKTLILLLIEDTN